MLLTALLVASAPRPAAACSCVVPDLAASVEQAAVVFVGTQVSHTGSGFETILTLEVHTVYQGDLGTTIDLRTADNSAACGIMFSTEVPSGVVAYADGEGGLSVNLCSSGWSADEVAAFFDDESIPPTDTTTGTTTPTTIPPPTVPPTVPTSTIAPPPATVSTPTTPSSTSTLSGSPTPSAAAAPSDGLDVGGMIARGAAVIAIAGAVIGVAATVGRPRP